MITRMLARLNPDMDQGDLSRHVCFHPRTVCCTISRMWDLKMINIFNSI
jgi:hypothetical protein